MSSKKRGEQLLYPERLRCLKCRRFLSTFDAYFGLYCSQKCAGLPPEPADPHDLPRMCKSKTHAPAGQPRWQHKVAYSTKAEAMSHCSPPMEAYQASCGSWHIGTDRSPKMEP